MKFVTEAIINLFLFCSNISFSVQTSSIGNCDPLDNNKGFREGIELAIRFSSLDVWFPVLYLSIGNTNISSIRGITIGKVEQLKRNEVKEISIEMCNFRLNDTFMIRWLQSSSVVLNRQFPRDIWSLDEISMHLKTGETDCNILEDSFDNITQRYKK